VAIAAITVTDERKAEVDFSNVYFVSEDAGLVRADFHLQSITNVEQLADLRVGVERGTVYDNWFETNLVETGMMPASNLLRYERAEHAVRDLAQGRNDVVALDLQPAQIAANELNLTIAWQGLYPQRLAIAMGHGEGELQTQINNALTTMQNSGRLSALITEYTQIPPENIIPPPTPDPVQPTATPQPTPTGCINGLAFLGDLNLNDENMTNPPSVPAGTSFNKGWRLQNTGTCNWTPDYRFVYVSGNNPAARMGGQPTPVQGLVSTGQQYDMWVALTAPLTPGTYQGFWQMVDENNRPFGQRVWVGIVVPGVPTPTPLPTQTPSPNINFTVDRDRIRVGECATFTWNVSNAQTQFFYERGENYWEHQVPGQGSSTQCPTHTTDFELRVQLNNGSVEIRRITIFVEPNPQAPTINRFTVDPHQINAGQCVTIVWNVAGNVRSVNLFRDNSALWNDAPSSNSFTDCPPGSGTMQYRLEATGSGGTSRASQNVSVVVPATPVPTVTPTVPPATATAVPTQVPPPVINNFAVSPAQIRPNECVSISWSASGGTNFVQVSKNGRVILDNAPLSGNLPDCTNDAVGQVNYQLLVRNQTGQSDTRQTAVTVIQPQQPTPTPPVIEGSWAIQQYRNASGQLTPVSPNSTTPVTVAFLPNGELHVSGGCNSFSGSYTVNNNQITIQVGMGTQIMCSDEINQQETAVLASLNASTRWAVPADSANQLTLSDAQGQTIVAQRLVATPF
jgi:heat shock protein HslJ